MSHLDYNHRGERQKDVINKASNAAAYVFGAYLPTYLYVIIIAGALIVSLALKKADFLFGLALLATSLSFIAYVFFFIFTILLGKLWAMLINPVLAALARAIEPVYRLAEKYFRSSQDDLFCENTECLNFSSRYDSHFKAGERFCEVCYKKINQLEPKKQMSLAFGKFNAADDDLRLDAAATSKLGRSLHLTDIYIDTGANLARLEPILVYLHEYPPLNGIENLTCHIKGDLNKLKPHLRNNIKHTFAAIKQL